MLRSTNYLSVCSGIEAATVAWKPLGWQAVAYSEIEKFPSAVLKHHYPDTPNWGDMTKYKDWPDADFNVLVGGTPCQSFSIAGLRKGLADPRGNLALVYLGIADNFRPDWVVWENVPGVLPSGGGRDFGSFLGALGKLGYGWAYRVLDAQYFGVAQRRRRVFVVGYLGDWRPAHAVLFERESLCGHPAPRRKTGTKVAGTLEARASTGGCKAISAEGVKTGANVARTLLGKAHSSHDDSLETFVLHTPRGARRLAPRECERLQGFPDDYTQIPWRGKDAKNCPNGLRYKAIGNSMAVPVMHWIGKRIDQVATILEGG